MRTRAPRDPLAPDAIERFLDRHGLVRTLVAGIALSATLVISGMVAIFFVTGLWMTAEVVAPQVPRAILGLGAPDPRPTDRVAPAVAQVAPTAQTHSGRVGTPVNDPTVPASSTSAQSTTTAAVTPSAAAVLAVAAGTAPAAPPALSWASPLAPPVPTTGTPSETATVEPMAAPAAVRPTIAPTSAPDTTTSNPAPVTSTATTTTTAPSPSASNDDDHHKDHDHCKPHKRKRGKC